MIMFSKVRRIVELSDEELHSGTTILEHIQIALTLFHTHAFVILENAIPETTLTNLRPKMYADAEAKRLDPRTTFNQGTAQTNFSLPPPLDKDFLFESIWANKHAVAILEHLIGPKPQLTFASTNVILPSPDTGAR